MNEQAVLELVFREGPLTRPEIARRLGLSKPTTFDAIARLRDAGLVRTAGRREGRPGRTPELYAVDAQLGIVAALDVSGVDIRVSTADLYGERLSEKAAEPDPRGGEALVRQAAGLVRDAVAGSGVDASRLAHVGLATPGVVDPATQRVRLTHNVTPRLAERLGWHEIDVVALLSEELGTAVTAENDVNLAAIGERWRGVAVSVPDFVFVSVGRGVGMGIIQGGELYRGSRGAAGEIAYLPLAASSLQSSAHQRSLEDEINGPALLAAARQLAGDSAIESVQELMRRADQGDRGAVAAILGESERIGTAVAAVAAVLDPDLVVLGGSVGSSPTLLEPVTRTVAHLLPVPPRIETTALGSRASLEGALALALRAARHSVLVRQHE